MAGRTASNAAAASGQMAVTTAAGLVYFGFLMRTLGPEVLGGWLAWISLGMLACLADLGLRQALVLSTAIAVAAGDFRRASDLLDSTVITVAASMAIALAVLMGVLPQFFDFGAAARLADPWMIGGVAAMVWLQRVGDVFSASLEGLQRYTIVACNNIFGALVGLATVVALVPHWGVHAASAGLIAQYGLSGLGHLFALRRLIPGHRWLPRRWSPSLSRQGLGYGIAMQGTVGTFLLIELAVKTALSRSDALALLSFFDLAFRIGRGLRSLLTAGSRVLVPRLAKASAERGQDTTAGKAAAREVESVYLRSFQVMLFVAMPTFALCAAGAGLISLLTRGVVDPLMVSIFLLTLPAWYLYSVADPVLNQLMAAGSLRPMLWAHGAMLVVLATGFGLSSQLPLVGADADSRGIALIVAASVAIMLPSLWMILQHHRSHALPVSSLAPGRALVATCLGVLAVYVSTLFGPGLSSQTLGLAAAGMIVVVGLRVLPAWNPALAFVRGRLRKARVKERP